MPFISPCCPRSITRYEGKLYAVALSILKNPTEAEDAVSTAMLKIIDHFEQFLKIYENSRAKIGPWAVTIVKNTARDLLRQRGHTVPLAETWDPPAPDNPEDEAIYRCLFAAILSMPEEYQQVAELRFAAGWPVKEIARATGLSEGAVKGRVERSRALLREKLREAGYEYERR